MDPLRRIVWTSFLLMTTACLITYGLSSSSARAASSAVMVWEFRCLSDIRGDRNTRLVAPLKEDGTPDMKRSYIVGVHATYKPECGVIEVQK